MYRYCCNIRGDYFNNLHQVDKVVGTTSTFVSIQYAFFFIHSYIYVMSFILKIS